MFIKMRFDDAGHMDISTVTQATLHQKGDELYFECAKCKAKNYVEMDTGTSGLPQLIFTHAKS